MNVNVTPMPTPTPAAPVEPKRRTITLTNRAPIQIVEDEWPVVAQGWSGDNNPEAPWGWTIEIRVRQGKYGRMIIHGKYDAHNEIDEGDNQTVRVGRVLSDYEAVRDLWKHMLEVGEEMRSRIEVEKRQKYVTLAMDSLFASLKPQPH